MLDNPESLKYLVVYGSITLLLLTLFIIVLVNLYQRRHHAYQIEKAARETAFGQELMQARIELREETMVSFGHDLHDHVSPNMGRIVQDMNVMQGLMERNQIPLEIVADAKARLIILQNEVRDISKAMSAITLENFGLAEALREQVEKLQNNQGTSISFKWEGTFVQLDKKVELVLYRMAQETIGNALKYAEAIQIMVFLKYMPNHLEVLVSDNGKGFDIEKINSDKTQGTGLRRLASRAKNIRAELSIKSLPGEGTTICISIPYSSLLVKAAQGQII